jgi:hypothetical protein
MADAADYIPLARAAALVYGRLLPGVRVKDAKTLDLLALAISTRVALYRQEDEKGPLQAVDEGEIARGRFTRGATRLEFPDHAPLRFLLVARRELYPAIDAMLKDPTCPIWRVCRPQSRQWPPAYSSATGA